ncbi:hypothetical protein [Nitrobacter winogradskyi]|uniref:Uncharacterized protein n=2 Tax=Nitrobacter winogradskyi TaxID=913 RepID=A0ACC6AMT8_NITWI|nr:hypothetical protein [Nitrobacter winogradskyi]MCP2001178.1 hypothetical protein [Nitrobacter winogradskyi]GEC17470.1 hypothetical protein NWI01_33620 [Nitrobacter winogradskyi]
MFTNEGCDGIFTQHIAQIDARYMKDGKQKTGMKCIYGWYYDDKSTIRTVYDAFDKYPTYPPGAIIDVLVKQKCGE